MTPSTSANLRQLRAEIDFLGIIYLALGLGLLQIVLDRGQRADWFAAWWVCIFTVVAASSLILLVFRELQFPEPILDLSILRIPLFDVSVSLILVMIFIVYGLSLLNPLFFQELLDYSPWKLGIAVLPRGFGSVVGMLLVGQLSRRAFDTRWLVGLGFVVLAYALWSMSSWTLDVSIESVRLVMILSGLGTGLIFPVMSKATLACAEKERMGYATSLYGMMRNIGGAVGISLVSNMLNSREQTHQAYLAEHFTVFSAWRLDQMAPHMRGSPHLNLMQVLAKNQIEGFGLISQNLQQQASLLAYNDIYRLLALASALCIRVFLLLKRSDGKPAAAH